MVTVHAPAWTKVLVRADTPNNEWMVTVYAPAWTTTAVVVFAGTPHNKLRVTTHALAWTKVVMCVGKPSVIIYDVYRRRTRFSCRRPAVAGVAVPLPELQQKSQRKTETTAVHQPLPQAYQSAGGTSCGPLVCLCYTRVAIHRRSFQSARVIVVVLPFPSVLDVFSSVEPTTVVNVCTQFSGVEQN